MPALATYSLTGDPAVNALLGDYRWATNSFTYSSPTSASYYGNNYGSGEPQDNFGALNATQNSILNASLSMYSSVANLSFTHITETNTQHADLRFAMSDTPSTAWAYYPSTAAEGGDAWFNNSNGSYDNPAMGNYANSTFLHEIGHALGLEHPHTGNVMPTSVDSLEYSVMSYRSFVGGSLTGGYTNETWSYPQSLMMYDIAALQHMYGANYNTNSGNTTYSWSPTTGEMFINSVGQGAPGANRIFLTVWDGGGVDTYDFSNYATDLTVNLQPGGWTTTSSAQLALLHYNGSQVAAGNIANALLFNGNPASLIENAMGGSGNDVMIGNSAANVLWGHGGDDEIYGGWGNDTLVGGDGSDQLFGGPGNDQIYAGSGHDYVSGGPGDDLVYGGLGNDILAGDDGNDRLFGGMGNDSLYGGAGNDLLFGEAGDDVIYGGPGNDVLGGGDGNDQLFGGAGADSLYGGPGNDVLFGGAGNDVLYGGPGNDVLDGGAGADFLVGGEGQDTFVFRAAGDSAPGAMDTIQDFVSGVDTIDLQQIDANWSIGGNQAFSFIGAASFSQSAGELNFVNQLVSGDMNGDGIAELQIYLPGVTTLWESDFIL